MTRMASDKTYTTFTMPNYTHELCITPSFIVMLTNKPPNIFHRLMQRLIFGFKYNILNKENENV